MWLPCFCFPCRTSLQQSTYTCCVLAIAHEYSYQYGTFNISIFQSIMANTVEITPHLTDNPRAQLESWLESVASAARTFCADHSQWGALSLACTEAHWQALHGNPAIAAPRQVFADPGPLDPLANPAVRQQHKSSSITKVTVMIHYKQDLILLGV